MQNLPDPWTVGDMDRFNVCLDVLAAYQALDYVRGKIGAQLNQVTQTFLANRQQDIANLLKTQFQFFMQEFGQQ